MQHISLQDISNWDRFYRANFINCLSGFKPAALIGTIKENGLPNLGLFSNMVHIGSDPAIIGFINRPIAAAPHTITNIERTGVYTINLISSTYTAHAHQASAKYDADVDEFNAIGFTTMYNASINAPFVKESKVKFALQLLEIVPIKHNGTFLVLGSITDVFIDEDLITNDGFIQLEKAHTITSLGIDAYYTTTLQERYAYAKPDVPVTSILKG
jgi:flavin reductase (DIM6/NTAB) family NADH-FMN oxidoreductase RutF